MGPAIQETEQQILSKELKVDKKLQLSNDIDRRDGGFKAIIANSIRPIDFKNLRGKLDALRESVSYPNNYVFASLADRVYEEANEVVNKGKDLHGKEVLGSWKLLTVGYLPPKGLITTIVKDVILHNVTGGLIGDPNGYSGAAYWNPNTQQVIIAHKGTDSYGDCNTDLKGVFLNQHVAQIDSAITFTDKIISALKEINKATGSNIQLFITGHSLGGWLASITAFSAKYLKKDGGYFIASNNFEETGYHVSAVAFDGPGCKNMLERIQDRLMDRYGPSLIDSLDITNYLSAPNLVNACNLQVGESYRVFIKLSNEDKRKPIDVANLIYTFGIMHKMEKIKEVFDHETGEVLKDNGKLRIKKVRDWPLLISGDEEATYRDVAVGAITSILSFALPRGIVKLSEWTYKTVKHIKWYSEFQQELNNFLKFANSSNDYGFNNEGIHLKPGGREVRYRTEDYKNERSLNVFTRPERQFLEIYKLLENHQNELPDELKFKNLFSSLKQSQELNRKIMKMLEDCTIKNEVIYSKNLREFIPYIKRVLHFFPEMKSEVEKAQQSLPMHILSTFYQSASSLYIKSINSPLKFANNNLKLGDFLKSSELKILHIVQSNTSLEADRVYETFKMVENCYRNSEYHGFFSLDRISCLGASLFIGFLKKLNHYRLKPKGCKLRWKRGKKLKLLQSYARYIVRLMSIRMFIDVLINSFICNMSTGSTKVSSPPKTPSPVYFL